MKTAPDRLIVPVNPPLAVTVIVTAAEEPIVKLTLVGLAAILKSWKSKVAEAE